MKTKKLNSIVITSLVSPCSMALIWVCLMLWVCLIIRWRLCTFDRVLRKSHHILLSGSYPLVPLLITLHLIYIGSFRFSTSKLLFFPFVISDWLGNLWNYINILFSSNFCTLVLTSIENSPLITTRLQNGDFPPNSIILLHLLIGILVKSFPSPLFISIKFTHWIIIYNCPYSFWCSDHPRFGYYW